MLLKVMKYTIFTLITLFLILIWKFVFIIQGGIGHEGNILILPFKLLPIFICSSLTAWLILKMFDQNKKFPKRRNISLSLGAFALILSLSFQHFYISNKTKSLVFNNPMLSHLEEVKSDDNLGFRLGISAAEYLRLMPLGSEGNSYTSYLANIAKEAALVLELKELTHKNNLENTCKNYIEKKGDYSSCIVDLQKEVHAHFQLTSTGNVLLLALGSSGIFRIKDILNKKHGKKDVYTGIKSVNDIIESTLLQANSSKAILTNSGKLFQFTMGYELNSDSIISSIERQMNLKSMGMFIKSVDKLIDSTDKGMAKLEKNQKKSRTIASQDLIKTEKKRFKKLRDQFLLFKNHGFSQDQIKKKQETLDKDIARQLEQLKQRSFMFKIAAFFDESLYDLTVEDFKKKFETKSKVKPKDIKSI